MWITRGQTYNRLYIICRWICMECRILSLSLQDMHIISTDEKQVFAAVQEWNQNHTFSLYISDSPGVYFTLSLENLRTSRGPAGNLLVDFYKVSTGCVACSGNCESVGSR